MSPLLFGWIVFSFVLLLLAIVTDPRIAPPATVRATINARKRRSPATAYVIVQTYFTITEHVYPFCQHDHYCAPIPLAYGARIAVPSRFAPAARNLPEFHAVIQLPGAYIVR